jgi:hypothetical protein
MHGSASKINATYPSRARFGRVGPMLSHLPAAGGTPKRCANWAFVSPVSPVSPNLKLIEKKKVGNGRRGITGGQAPCAETGRTGGIGVKVTRFYGETAEAGHAWDRWDTPARITLNRCTFAPSPSAGGFDPVYGPVFAPFAESVARQPNAASVTMTRRLK